MKPKYVIDTCSLILMKTTYPQDVFPRAWDLLADLTKKGHLISVDEVLVELSKRDDEIHAWAKENQNVFLPLAEDIQKQARDILRRHPTLVDVKRRKSGADPFVISAAHVNGCDVVTEELPSRKKNVVKIPDVCRSYSIEALPLLEVFRREGLRA